MLEMSFVRAVCYCSDQLAAAAGQTFADSDCVSVAHDRDNADSSGEAAVNIATRRIVVLLIVTLKGR